MGGCAESVVGGECGCVSGCAEPVVGGGENMVLLNLQIFVQP